MTFMKALLSSIAFCTIILLTNCSDSPGITYNYDRSFILKNVAENIAIPAFKDFADKSISLDTSIASFIANPNTETLTNVKATWLEAKTAWKRAEMFRFGSVDDLSYETSLDFWPTSAVGIENETKSYDASETYLDGVGSNKKGLPAIEYLLFAETDENVIEAFADEKRQGYLKALSSKLANQASEILAAWEGDYKTAFIANTGNDAGSSATLLANNMIILVETIKNKKVDAPAGLQKGSLKNPKAVESYYAEKSMEMITANLYVVREVFTGQDGSGFDDYLDALNVKGDESANLSADITSQIDACLAAAAAITDPLQMAIDSQREKVQDLFVKTQNLTVMMKTDMMSRLGLIVTYSDNDGD